jgi:hypothetical protein
MTGPRGRDGVEHGRGRPDHARQRRAVHAKLIFTQTGLAIADAGSATGTFVNGEKVDGEHPLQAGDRVCLGPPGAKGSAKLLVFLPGAGETPTLATGMPSLQGMASAPSFHGETPALAFGGEEAADAAPAFDLGAAAESGYAGEEPLFASPLPPAAPPEPMRPAPPPPAPEPPRPVYQPAPAARSTSPAAAARAARARARAGPGRSTTATCRRSRWSARPAPAEFPSLRPAARPAAKPAAGKAKGKSKPKSRSFSMPTDPGGADPRRRRTALALVGRPSLVLRAAQDGARARLGRTGTVAAASRDARGKSSGKDAAHDHLACRPTW